MLKAIDPSYHFDSLGFPPTLDGQIRQINDLRWDLASATYRFRGDPGPLQLETMRYLQRAVDVEYDNALALAKSGRLPPALSERVAIGNYIDAAVKRDLLTRLNVQEMITGRGSPVQVNGREYDSSGEDLTYSIPDARVYDIAYDVTLWRKTPGLKQIVRYFNSDFKPRAVIIIRPSQLGPASSYIITRPGK